ncbi:MAG: signal peptidase I [Sediminicola sp.]|jgi:signal peptidase I|tara:strand:- start:63 stop:332 length:270 start_codon:yes stop_codon:yes gene_type:complete
MGKVVMISLEDKIVRSFKLTNKIKIASNKVIDKSIQNTDSENWNADNFSPLIISDEKCFLIGDNRHNSEDSRYIGLINISDIVGVVIKK